VRDTARAARSSTETHQSRDETKWRDPESDRGHHDFQTMVMIGIEPRCFQPLKLAGYARSDDRMGSLGHGGTLVLAGATFAAVRSSNRSARIAERTLLVGLRPVLTPSRRGDPGKQVQYADGRMFEVGAGRAMVREEGGAI
jgi:hypothetical protein